MADICAIMSGGEIGGIVARELTSLRKTMNSGDVFNFLTTLTKNVVSNINPKRASAEIVKEKLEIRIKPFLRNNDNSQEIINEIDKIINEWFDKKQEVELPVDSINPNVASTSEDIPIIPNNKGIEEYYINPAYISEYINTFRQKVISNVFMYNGNFGIQLVKNNLDLNKSIKKVKNNIVLELIQDLSELYGTFIQDFWMYDKRGVFNRLEYDKLITEATNRLYRTDFFKGVTLSKERHAFNRLMMLKTFDKSIQDYLPDVISINKLYYNSNKEPRNGIKYRIDNKTNIVKNFGDSNKEDIFDHTNSSMKYFIESITYGDEKIVTMNEFNKIFSIFTKTLNTRMIDMRFNPEETLITVLQEAKNDKSLYLNKKYLSEQFDAIYNKLNDLYTLSKNGDGLLYPIIANYVAKLTQITYTQLTWDNKLNRYVNSILDTENSTIIRSDFEKSLMEHSKFNDLTTVDGFNINLDSKYIKFNSDKAKYYLSLSGEDIRVFDNQTNQEVVGIEEIHEYILNDSGFINYFEEVFGGILEKDHIADIYDLDKSEYFSIYNMMGNVILNSKYFNDNPELRNNNNDNLNIFTNSDVYSLVIDSTSDENKNDNKINQVLSKLTSSLRVGGFNKGWIALNLIYRSHSSLNGDLVKSYVTGTTGNMLPVNRLPNLINADDILFKNLQETKSISDNVLTYNIFRNDLELSKGTSLKTTISNKEGTTKDIKDLSTKDLMYDQIVFNFMNKIKSENSKLIGIQPVTYADKSQIWTKLIDVSKQIRFKGLDDDFAVDYLNGDTLETANIKNIRNLHYETMRGMFSVLQNNLVKDFNKLFPYLGIEETLENDQYAYESAINILNKHNVTRISIELAINQANLNGETIEVYNQIHFLVNKDGSLSANETLLNNFEIYNDKYKFNDSLDVDKKLWAYLATKNKLNIPLTFSDGSVNSIVSDNIPDTDEYKDNWIDNNTKSLILFKVKQNNEYKNEIRIGGKLFDTSHYKTLDLIKFDDRYIIELNPVIDRFFEVNALVSNNYVAASVGLPFIHPGKATIDSIIKKAEDSGNTITTDQAIKELESKRTSAHSKRMVIFGATIHPFMQNKINGIPENYNIAVIDDKVTEMFNIQGTKHKQDQFDGGVIANPFTSIWEANSLPELSLSPIHRKSIGFFANPNYLSSGLGKWATFSFTNELIRNASSKNNIAINGRELMSKMTNRSWIIPNLDITNHGSTKYSGNYYYDRDIKSWMRIDNIEKLPISEIGRNPYNITLTAVDSYGNKNVNIGTLVKPIEINSNYDLWITLGGEYSAKINENTRKLNFSEDSIEKVADVANKIYISRNLEGYEKYLREIKDINVITYNNILENLKNKFPQTSKDVKYVSQSYYLQPMKHSDIHYVAPNSAVKNGAGNVSKSSNWNGSNPLNSWNVSTRFLGIQLNSDHEVDNSEISEMSQVISACAELGNTHGIATKIYESIGESVENNLKDLNIALSFNDKERLHYILGKQLCESFTRGKGWDDYSLANSYLRIVLDELGKNFEIYKTEGNKKFKLPFDDPNIFGAFYNQFVSQKNAEVIRRKYSGLGGILIPSQDLTTVYDINGVVTRYSDMLRIEADGGLNVAEQLAALDTMINVSEIEVGDFVEIDGQPFTVQGYDNLPENGKVGLQYIRDLRTINPTIKKLGSYGRNLRNSNHKFTINPILTNGNFSNFDIWDLDSSRLSHGYKELLPLLDFTSGNPVLRETLLTNVNRDKITNLYNILLETSQRINNKYGISHIVGNFDNDIKYINETIQDDLDLIDGRDYNGKRVNPQFRIPIKYRNNQTFSEILKHDYTSYELIMGATQASAFGLDENDNIQDILTQGDKFFYDRFTRNRTPKISDYDIYLSRLSGDNLYILKNSNGINTRLENLNAVEFTPDSIIENDSTYRVIDGIKSYIINENEKWYRVEGNDGRIYEVVVVNNANDVHSILKSNNYDEVLYKPVSSSYKQLLFDSSIDYDKFILEVDVKNEFLSKKRRNEAKRILQSDNLEGYLEYDEKYLIPNNINEEQAQKNAKRRFQSFLQYLDFIASRIPAQSMQSFMNMKLVGFLNTNTNAVIVPAFQFWLQGSDLDIDKAFILGATIGKNGFYCDWSPLFNYNSKEHVDASNELPIPNGKVYTGGGELIVDPLSILNFKDLNIDNYDTATPQQIKELAQFIGMIQNLNTTELNIPESLAELISIHTSQILDPETLNNALKNKVWYLLKSTGADPKNFFTQMNPISLDLAQNAADSSPEGEDSKLISLTNPASIMMLQLQNSIGKDCIGISATGSKIASALIQYYNARATDLYRGIDVTSKMLGNFNKNYNMSFYNESENKYITSSLKLRKWFSNINWKNLGGKLNNNINQFYLDSLKEGTPENILGTISILISISTDNAKELILQKIGATKDLMSVYIYTTLMGADFYDVSKFMTLPEISMVQRKGTQNILDESEQDMTFQKAVAYYLNGVNPDQYNLTNHLAGIDLWFNNLKKFNGKDSDRFRSLVESLSSELGGGKNLTFDQLIGSQVTDKDILDKQKKLIDLLLIQLQLSEVSFNKIEREKKTQSQHYDENQGFDEDLEDIFNLEYENEDFFTFKGNKTSSSIQLARYLNEAKSRINDLLSLDDLESVFVNIQTLKEIKDDSEHITVLGSLLSINQGIATKQVDRINKRYSIENRINRVIQKVAKEKNITVEPFDLRIFFSKDLQYLELKNKWISIYEDSQNAINILDVISKSPHFSKMWEAYETIQTLSDTVSIKSELTEKILREFKSNNTIDKITQTDVSSVNGFIDDIIINKFLTQGFYTKYINTPMDLTMVYDDTNTLVEATSLEKEYLDFRNPFDRNTFVYWFEKKFIPKLKKNYKNKNNPFIDSLITTRYTDELGQPKSVVKLTINMMSSRDADKIALNSYIDGFYNIKDNKTDIGNTDYTYTIEEVFFLYNLLTNKNKFGESSLTKIFDASLRDYEKNPNLAPNLIIDYFNFESNILNNPDIIFKNSDYNINDLYLRFATKGKKSDKFYWNRGENDERIYYDNKGNKIENIIPSVLQLPYTLDLTNLVGYQKTKKLENQLRRLSLQDQALIKFVKCDG